MSILNSTRSEFVKSALRIIDVSIAIAIVIAGLAALLNPPQSVLHSISWPWLILVWGSFLFAGGVLSGFGRLSGFWFPEALGLVLTMTGSLIYVIVVVTYSWTTDVGALVVAGLVVAAFGAQLHRYVEIQVFTSEPTDRTWLGRFFEMIRTRTAVRKA